MTSKLGEINLNLPNHDNFHAQLLGLTDSHIHYFAQNPQFPQKKVGVHKRMLPAFQALVAKAKELGITIEIASGFRSFERQLLIWNNKFTGKTAIKNIQGETLAFDKLSSWELIQAILLYSALPGGSRHHWGCDIDIYAPNLLSQDQQLQLEPWEYEQDGPMAKLSSFLAKEAQLLGFYFPYDCYRGGIAKEPWHLSYAPLANQYQQAFDIKKLNQCVGKADIKGKQTIITNLDKIVEQFIVNINPELLSTNTQVTGAFHG
ncbi:MAG: M15 family metallopeptidase [Colwellia sp.]|nr:M15 family metallopeptidase [Colwellia sp.]MCW9082136.1 M15 family metallopeptidase [Colwellia sp.]